MGRSWGETEGGGISFFSEKLLKIYLGIDFYFFTSEPMSVKPPEQQGATVATPEERSGDL